MWCSWERAISITATWAGWAGMLLVHAGFWISQHPSLDPAALLPVAAEGTAGLTRWRERDLDQRLDLARRVLPDDLFDGFFLARIGKSPIGPERDQRGRAQA